MKDWIIGICNTEYDGVDIFRFRGTSDEVKQKLVDLVMNDRHLNEWNEDEFDFGTNNADEVQDVCNGHEFYAFGNYHSFHIDYTATEFANIDFI